MRMIGMLLAVWRFVMCRVLHLHRWKVSKRTLYRSVVFDDRNKMKRAWILQTDRECKRCGVKDSTKVRKGIASDWQDPVRLFPGVSFHDAPLHKTDRMMVGG